MYASVQKSMCTSAGFVDTINLGKESDQTWIGTSRLGKQIFVFSDEAKKSQTYYYDFFTTYNSTINELPVDEQGINDEITAMLQYETKTVPNFI